MATTSMWVPCVSVVPTGFRRAIQVLRAEGTRYPERSPASDWYAPRLAASCGRVRPRDVFDALEKRIAQPAMGGVVVETAMPDH